MRVELSWVVLASDLREAECCVCGTCFEREVIEANLITDSDRLHMGEVCPKCLRLGPGYIENRMKRKLCLSTMLQEKQLHMEKRALGESVSSPSFSEYELLKSGVGGPRYRTSEEAHAAQERGEW